MDILWTLFLFLRDLTTRQGAMAVELLALRQQLAVLPRSAKRP